MVRDGDRDARGEQDQRVQRRQAERGDGLEAAVGLAADDARASYALSRKGGPLNLLIAIDVEVLPFASERKPFLANGIYQETYYLSIGKGDVESAVSEMRKVKGDTVARQPVTVALTAPAELGKYLPNARVDFFDTEKNEGADAVTSARMLDGAPVSVALPPGHYRADVSSEGRVVDHLTVDVTASGGPSGLTAALGGSFEETPPNLQNFLSRDRRWALWWSYFFLIVFVIFFLFGREDLRNRAIRLMGGELHATTEAMDEAAERVSRYLLLQLMINVGTSIPFGVALYFIGLPNAALWAVLAAILRFIPYVGPLIAALMPATVAAAVDPGWGMLLWTFGMYVAMEAITNNVIEPRVYGSGTGISEVAIIMAAVFWTTLWGPVGLFLSTSDSIGGSSPLPRTHGFSAGEHAGHAWCRFDQHEKTA